MSSWRIDKSSWPAGPWNLEPDAFAFETREGLPGAAIRNEATGAWCGYVGIPPSHPWALLPIMPLPEDPRLRALVERQPIDSRREYPDCTVHGGATYTGRATEAILIVVGELAGIFHWVGFDCGHCFDYQPGLLAHLPQRLRDLPLMRDRLEYRTLAYVRGQIDLLSEQAAEAAGVSRLSRRCN